MSHDTAAETSEEPRVPMTARALAVFFSMSMLLGAIGHVVAPDFYAPLVPPPIPLTLANVFATIVELALAILLFVPKTRALGALGFCALMVGFLPIHVWDALKDQPAVGSHTAATVRLVVQAQLIIGGVWLARTYRRYDRAMDELRGRTADPGE